MKTHIVIHHSATLDGTTFSWGAIRRYHMEEKGWTDIGYHYGVELVGEHYETLIGRLLSEDGAHCREMGMNHLGIGVCIVGNFDVAVPSDQQLERAVGLCRWLMQEYEIPASRVIGHREVGLLAGFDWVKGQYKSCPGARFELDTFRDLLA